MPATTRRALTWGCLTPASPRDTGDLVRVWWRDEPHRGIYCGIHESLDRYYAVLHCAEDEQEWIPVNDPVSIVVDDFSVPVRRVPLAALRDTMDAAEPQPHHDLRFILGFCVFSGILLLAAILHYFGR